MKIQKFLILVIVELLGFFSLNAQQITKKINNIKVFGIEMGSIMDESMIIKTTKTKNGEDLYLIEPKEKSKYFDNYYIMSTPITKKIYSIWGTKKYDNRNDCETNLNAIKILLEEKYKVKLEEDKKIFDLENFSSNSILLKDQNVGISLRCNKELFDDFYTLYLQYFQKDIEKLSKEEKIKLHKYEDEKSKL